MHSRQIAIGTVAYTVVTFVLAVVWHMVLFEDRYRDFGYFGEDPQVVLGFVAILIQGFVLSYLYPRVSLGGSGVGRGLRFALWVGLFFWTSHVLAWVAKQELARSPAFVAMETFYLILQFGIFGVLIGWIEARAKPKMT